MQLVGMIYLLFCHNMEPQMLSCLMIMMHDVPDLCPAMAMEIRAS
jgi:hypothetical protein